jgi:transcriptional regulator with XRE-family HTH domain
MELRRRVAAGERQVDVAAEFSIDKDTAWSIVQGTTYRSESAGWYPGYAPSRPDYRTILAKDQVREIRRRYAAGGVCQRELADEFGMTQTGISRIVRGEVYRDLIEQGGTG